MSKVVTEVKSRQKGDRTFTLGNGLQVVQTAGEEDAAGALMGHTLQNYKILLDGMQAAFCFPIPLEADGVPPGSDGMHVPCNGLAPVRYWGVNFGTALFDLALVAATICAPRMLPGILDAVNCRLVDLLGEVESCLDTTVHTLTMEREVWLPPSDSPSPHIRERGQREDRRSHNRDRDVPKYELREGKCRDWANNGSCPNYMSCPWRVSHTNANRGTNSRATGEESRPGSTTGSDRSFDRSRQRESDTESSGSNQRRTSFKKADGR